MAMSSGWSTARWSGWPERASIVHTTPEVGSWIRPGELNVRAIDRVYLTKYETDRSPAHVARPAPNLKVSAAIGSNHRVVAKVPFA
jgi:hypothetical protein